MLHRNVEELRNNYLNMMYDTAFQKEFNDLLQVIMWADNAALHLAKCLSNLHNTNVYLKRDLKSTPVRIK